MAETAYVFKGLRFVTALPETTSIEKNVIYFVRTNEGKTDGYLYFNGKKYGTGADIITKYGELDNKTISAYVADQITAVNNAAAELGKKVTANEDAIATINGEAEGSIKKAVADAKTAVIGTEKDAATVDTIKGAKKAANEAKAVADAKVASVTAKEGETAIVVDNTTATAPTVALKLDNSGNVQFAETADGLKGSVEIPAATVTGVKADDKFLSLTDKLVEADVSIAYDADDKKIYLYGKDKTKANAVSSIDCKAFIKDGMLDGSALYTATAETGTVTINTKEYNLTGLIANHAYIVLVWNTDAAKDAMAIDVTSLIDIYTAGNGLSLTDHEFSVDTAKIATVESVNGVADRVTTLEGKVGSAAVEDGAAATGLFKETADNKAAIDKLNGADTVEGSVDYKIKTALDKGAVTLEVKDNDAYLGVTSATTEGKGTVYTLASKEAEINKAIKTAADAVKVSVNGGTYVTGSVDVAGRAITLSETVQEVETSSADAKGLAEASDVKAYVDGKVSGKNVTAEGESGEKALVTASAADNKVTVNATDKLKNAVAKAETSVQSVNGKDGASVTLTGADIATDQKVDESTTATVNTVLADIYTKLGVAVKADGKTIKEAADHTLSVNLEDTSDALVQAGHIEIKQNTDGALYGVMYCLGDDAE